MSTEKEHAGLTVVITGASSGIGKGLAQQLAAQGANIVLAARRTQEIEVLAEACGPNAIAVTTDVSREEDVAKLFETTMGVFSSIDVWINNAGIGTYGSFTDTPLRDLNRTVEINFLGTIYGSHHALKQFKKQGYGTLINVSSFASKTPMPFGAAYTGSKYGVSGLSNGLHQEMRMDGFDDIHVCSVDPWVTDTPWTQHAGNYSGHEIIVGPADDPQKVVDAVTGLIDHPQKSVEISAKSKGIAAAGSLLPKTTKGLTGRALLKMIQDAPPAPPTEGSLYESGPEGTDVSGNLRERLKEQK
ncbi:SDR family NAD(P)-dependent oxidoreductase [Planococcus sp. CPCC 101016]|uniref:SDR family NAD(P)-dependent oxidoreductase n=1 Tax=Planococcus sp. CPCC 101016 TaxID=2599617 RepID=UPI0011B41B67|nr:SDR family NAD(P)-dependent oxidoreductase [Planococcus sp. CPCC 101016]TWT06586.1 SDR family NAD(P)-dependent oxidoreductase [Planococcus sp. CPCC 101016]